MVESLQVTQTSQAAHKNERKDFDAIIVPYITPVAKSVNQARGGIDKPIVMAMIQWHNLAIQLLKSNIYFISGFNYCRSFS